MSKDWRPAMPLKSFIESQRGCPSSRATDNRRRVFNDKGTLTLWAILRNTTLKLALHEVEGTLKMQRMILQTLASKENTAKGLSESESQSPASISQIDLDHLKKETCLMLRDTRSRNGRK